MLVARVLCAFTLCLIPAGGVAQPNELDGRAVDPVAGTSECARTCFTKTNHTEAFQGSQTEDLCRDKPLYHNVEICLKHDCNFTEILDFKNRTFRACDWPITDRRQEIRISCLTIGILAMVFFTMRAISKIIGFVPYGHDDSLILAALPFIIAFNIFCQILTSKGLGLDIWFVDEDNIRIFLILIFASELSYATSLALVKLSILAFFLRIFPDQRFRIIVRWTTIFILVMCPLYLALILAQRRPLDLFWNGWRDKNSRGVILSGNLIGITHGTWNVALDIWMMILPMTQLLKIGIKLKKKIGVIAMFGVGLFLTIVSSVRIPSLLVFSTSRNITADSVGIIIWSNIEICVGMMVACMPGARQFVRDIILRLKRGNQSDGSSTENIFIERTVETIQTDADDTVTSSIVRPEEALLSK
ncbi:related to integral membrane protein [Fusarium fujikuroi]|nr:related to integral membrane protein [Fusarium fujikuroi]